jgi:hypothetical protein
MKEIATLVRASEIFSEVMGVILSRVMFVFFLFMFGLLYFEYDVRGTF